jgi:DNA-binding transcriptional LysR family regulator
MVYAAMAQPPRTLRSANLNLIPVLRALLKEASVSRAAETLGLSQSATSGALARLRELLDDPVLVQVGRQMRLTPRAQELILPLEQLCGALEDLLRSDSFDPAHTEHQFVVAAPDFIVVLIGGAVLDVLRVAAPKVSIFFVNITPDLAERLASGAVDMAILDVDWSSWKGLSSSLVYTDHSVGVVRRDHPLAAIAAPSVAEISRYQQIRWRSQVINTRPSPSPVTRPVSVFTRQFTVLPLLALQSDSVATLPRMFAEWMARLIPLAILELPYPMRPIQVGLLWSPVHEADPAHRWFRKMLEAVLPKGAAGATAA